MNISKMKNLLLQIIDTIIENKWCFNYDGSCGTCGMMDVKSELKKYSIDEIIESFKELNFKESDVKKNIVGLEKLYSLMTGPYTVWNAQYKINELEVFFESKKDKNLYISRILASDYDTFWTKWKENNILRKARSKAREDKEQAIAKQRKKYIAQLKANNKEDRENGMRDVLIDKLNKMTTYEKLILMSNDTRHTVKYYPGNIACETIPEYINMLSSKQYEGLRKLFDMPVKGPSPWASFKKKYFKE